MTIILKQIFSLLKLLNSDKGANSLAAGVVCGMFLGFTPSLSPQTLIIFFLIFFLRIQIAMALLSATLFKLAAFPLDPLFHSLGAWALELESLRNFYTTLYNTPLAPLTRFNNTIIMGSALIAVILSIPVFLCSRWLISKYRDKIVARYQNSKFWLGFKTTRFYQWYMKYEELHG